MYLYGASGHAKVIIDILDSRGIGVSGLFDDNPALTNLYGIQVTGKYDGQELDSPLIISIGDNAIRAKVAKGIQLEWGLCIHKSAVISPTVQIGGGTVIMQGAIVQANACIGEHVIINTNAAVDHDCEIGNFAHISPGSILSGNVKIGEGTHVGAGAVVIQGLKIGKWCKIGAGTIVIRDVPDHCTAVGNPARIIKTNSNES